MFVSVFWPRDLLFDVIEDSDDWILVGYGIRSSTENKLVAVVISACVTDEIALVSKRLQAPRNQTSLEIVARKESNNCLISFESVNPPRISVNCTTIPTKAHLILYRIPRSHRLEYFTIAYNSKIKASPLYFDIYGTKKVGNKHDLWLKTVLDKVSLKPAN